MTDEPIGCMGLLAQARADLRRLRPCQALAEQARGAVLIDVRTPAHRADSVEIPGALVVDLTILPWRLDPAFEWRIPEAVSWEQRYILLCRHGYSSSLAAWNLRQMGLTNATDVIGGVEAWIEQGLPTTTASADVRA
ncbi:rhodanese-like domain-containing protein [Kocuria sp.]|uniref:rhodanese-like domain-containing protein n=1 Tax=Kocuria sp. TaxID=1871328 RepID=UPI0026E05667|nr:rhodanese-like domain-containing protein [Kocuria sp.]MDO5619644.1 rhodanese-like domain-containing protein [Kocuria sp.]